MVHLTIIIIVIIMLYFYRAIFLTSQVIQSDYSEAMSVHTFQVPITALGFVRVIHFRSFCLPYNYRYFRIDPRVNIGSVYGRGYFL